MKPNLYLHVERATHFLAWETPYFQQFFNLVDTPSNDAILFAFGPDALDTGAMLPASKRVALLFPGFGYRPYHSLVHRFGMRKLIDDYYDLIFVNPGPLHHAFTDSAKVRLCPFSLDVNLVKVRRYRTQIDSLLHASSNAPQKDWLRSYEVMRMSGLRYEVLPSRRFPFVRMAVRILRERMEYSGLIKPQNIPGPAYMVHTRVVEKYHRYDGFVHIAAEKPPEVDGKYTATLLEAGLTGCILFWHDTLGLGNDFETIFDLPLEPAEAAREIQYIRRNIDVEAHSKRTVDEIYERVHPKHVMQVRWDAMQELFI